MYTMHRTIQTWFRFRSATLVSIVAAFCCLTNFVFCEKTGVDLERCIVWGPALDPRVVVPVRYFYIQAVNSAGENFTTSPGK